MNKQDILNAFREMRRLNGYASIWKYHPMGVARDIDNWLSTTLTEFEREIIKDIKKKLPKLQGFEDYEKHVHTYATENRGNCGICGLSWKRTTETGYYNQAIFDVKKVLSELEKEKRT